jgi:putative ABC transport system substrate-binding protein
VDRRAFIAGFLPLFVAPLAAEAQHAGKVYRIGILTLGEVTPRTAMWSAFLEAMRGLGYVEGQNLVVRRAAAGDGRPERLAGLAAGLLRDGVDLIVTTSTRETQAAKQVTGTVPIVMTLSPDPVAEGLAASLAHPGGNVTGLTNLVPGISQKYVELLKQIVPSASRFTVVARGPLPEVRRDLELAAERVGVGLSFAQVHGPDDIDRALAQAQKEATGGIIVPLDVVTSLDKAHLTRAALQHRLPGIYWNRDYAEAGGLMSYGSSLTDVGQRAATYVDKILKGARPADLPVEQPTKFELVINLKTAKALGLTIPPAVLARANEVIE